MPPLQPSSGRKKIDFSTITVQLIIAGLVVLFVYSSTSKWLDYGHFRIQLGQSPLLTDWAVPVSIVIPLTEWIAAFLLLHPRTVNAGLQLSLLLMWLFTGYIILATRFSPFTPCSCGGILQNMNWNQHLIFNAGVVAACLLAIGLRSTSPKIFIAINQEKAENLSTE